VIRRAVVLTCLALAVSFASPGPVMILGGSAPAGAFVAQSTGAVTHESGQTTDSPETGPIPRQSGDPGGSAQLTLLGLLIVAVSFIMWKILHDARGGRPPQHE